MGVKSQFCTNLQNANILRDEKSITYNDYQVILERYGCQPGGCKKSMINGVFKQKSAPRCPSRDMVDAMKRANSVDMII